MKIIHFFVRIVRHYPLFFPRNTPHLWLVHGGGALPISTLENFGLLHSPTFPQRGRVKGGVEQREEKVRAALLFNYLDDALLYIVYYYSYTLPPISSENERQCTLITTADQR